MAQQRPHTDESNGDGGSEVHLAVYDLSRGMARNLSAQFLGPAHTIDLIPHTGVVCFGREYFYGGGIQSADPSEFRRTMQIQPIEMVRLGHTTRTRSEFEAWCASSMRAGRWTEADYDLLSRNCNDFCHDACRNGLGMAQGVPERILGVPQQFLSSPMGQLVRPILEGMQVTGTVGGAGGGASMAPFANASVATSLAGGGPGSGTAAFAAPSAGVNPWATLSVPSATPVLDAHDRPLLSADTKTAGLCAKRLQKSLGDDDASKSALDGAAGDLAAGKVPSDDATEGAARVLLHILTAPKSPTDVTFALMLLRLLALHPPADPSSHPTLGECLSWVEDQLTGQDNTALASAASRSMAWCVLSNAIGGVDEGVWENVDRPVLRSVDIAADAAVLNLSPESQPRAEVRQSAAAFLYNVAHGSARGNGNDAELPDLLVSLLCGSLDGIVEETDNTARLRRLLVAGRVVKPIGGDKGVRAAARNLVADLGFAEAVSALAGPGQDGDGDSGKAQKLVREFQSLVEG